ncbi:MAG: T9SS type A sorting domain-containing protein [Muribaculaceae bacterium]
MKKLYLLFAFLFALIGYQDAGARLVFHDNGSSMYGDALSINAWGSGSSQIKMTQVATNSSLLHVAVVPETYSTMQFYRTGSDGDTDRTVDQSVTSGALYKSGGNNSGNKRSCGKTTDYGFKVYIGSTPTNLIYDGNNHRYSNNVTISGSPTFKLEDTKGWFKFKGNSDITASNLSTTLNYDLNSTSSISGLSGEYTVTFTPLDGKVTFTKVGGGDDPSKPSKYYLHTSITNGNGSNNWTSDTQLEMVLKAGTTDQFVVAGVNVLRNGGIMVKEVKEGSTVYWKGNVTISDSNPSVTLESNHKDDPSSTLSNGKYNFTWNKTNNNLSAEKDSYEVRLLGPGVRNPWAWDTGIVLDKQPDGTYKSLGVIFNCNTAFRIATKNGDDKPESWTRQAAADGQNPIIYSNYTYDAYVKATGQNGENAPGMRLNPSFSGGQGAYDVTVTLDTEGRPSISVVGASNGVWPRVYLYREDGKAHALDRIDGTKWGRSEFDTPLGTPYRYYIRIDYPDLKSKFFVAKDNTENASYLVGSTDVVDLEEVDVDTNKGRLRFPLDTETTSISNPFRNGPVEATVTFDSEDVNTMIPLTFEMHNSEQWSVTVGGTDHAMSATGNPGEYSCTFPLSGAGSYYITEKVSGDKYSNPDKTFNQTVTLRMTLDKNKQACKYTGLTGLNYTFTWNAFTKELVVSFPGSGEFIEAKLNMPLKKSDFAGKKKHYFVVGTRMGGWRLQPEWEIKPENNYSISKRLMYTGYFMIAMVDDYDDYINQRYTAYSNTNLGENYIESKGSHLACSISKVTPQNSSSLDKGMWTSLRYNEQRTKDQFNDIRNKTIRFLGLKSDESQGDPQTNETDMTQTLPVLADLKLTVDANGYPTRIEFSNVKTDRASVAPELTFSIVGSAFRNQSLDVNRTDGRTPLANIYKSDISKFEQGWQEGYIQFDSNSDPYVDNYGEFIYHTVFQSEYLKRNPVRFENSTGFKYTSNGLLFEYDEKRTHANHFSNVKVYESDGTTTTDTRDLPEGKMCFVVNNVWMRGAFKIWTGWGGSAQGYQGCDPGDAKDKARWYYRNGGHYYKDNDRVIYGSDSKSPIYFATANDRSAADFAVGVEHNDGKPTGGNLGDNDGVRTYFKRIELWWDPNSGFDNSVLFAYQEAGGPNIWIDYADKTHIGYNYNIPEENRRKGGDLYVDHYKIERLSVAIDADDNETYTTLGTVAEGKYNENEVSQAQFYGNLDRDIYIPDGQELAPGNYRYRITVWYHDDTNTPEGEPTGSGYKALSNMLTIRKESKPDADVRQYTETVEIGFGDEREKVTLYGFDVIITADAPDVMMERDADSEVEDALYGDIIDTYTVKLPANPAAGKLFTAIDVENSQSYNYDEATNTINVSPLGRDQQYRMPTITLRNVLPTLYNQYYTYTIGMTGTDAKKWEALNIESSTLSRRVMAPEVSIMGFQLEDIFPVTEAHPVTALQDVNSDMPMGGGMSGDYVRNYTKNFNQLTGKGKITALRVTDDVLKDWKVTYSLSLNRGDITVDYQLNSNSPEEIRENGKVVPESGVRQLNELDKDLTLTMEYMQVPYNSEVLTAGDGAHSDIVTEMEAAGLTYDKAIKMTGRWTLITSYRRRSGAAESEDYSSSTVTGNENPGGITTSTAEIDLTALNSRLAPVTNVNYLSTFPAKNKIGLQLHHSADGKNWYDAYVPVGFTKPDNDLNIGVGFYATNGAVRAHAKDVAPYGGEVVDTYNNDGYNAHWNINWTVDKNIHRDLLKENFAEVAAETGYLPIKLHHVLSTTSTKYDEKEVEKMNSARVILMTEYPILLHKAGRDYIAPIVSFDVPDLVTTSTRNTREVAAVPEFTHIKGQNNKHLTTISVPSYFDATVSSGTTDIEAVEGDNATKLSVFPNPAVDVVNIRSNAAIGKVEVVSVDGSLVKTAEIDDTTGSLDVSDMTSGLYIVRTASGSARLIVR